jgi:hypothetical protein
MVLINKYDKMKLEKVGLWKHQRTGKNSQDSNFTVCNKDHNSRAKTYYVVEELEVMRFLGIWDKSDVIKINQTQFDKLKELNFLNDKNIQKYNTYIPYAKCFISNTNEIYIVQDKKLLSVLGINR